MNGVSQDVPRMREELRSQASYFPVGGQPTWVWDGLGAGNLFRVVSQVFDQIGSQLNHIV